MIPTNELVRPKSTASSLTGKLRTTTDYCVQNRAGHENAIHIFFPKLRAGNLLKLAPGIETMEVLSELFPDGLTIAFNHQNSVCGHLPDCQQINF